MSRASVQRSSRRPETANVLEWVGTYNGLTDQNKGSFLLLLRFQFHYISIEVTPSLFQCLQQGFDAPRDDDVGIIWPERGSKPHVVCAPLIVRVSWARLEGITIATV